MTITIEVFAFFFLVNVTDKSVKFQRMAKQKLLVSMKNTQVRIFNYDTIETYLIQYGVKYMFGDKIDPLGYLGLKISSSVIFGVAGTSIAGVYGGICFLPLGFLAFDLVIKFSNNQDNEKMSKDIRSIYDTLRLQTKANVYLLQALSECYLCVQSQRLKSALLKLTSNIIANSDIEAAIDEFNLQFKNNYIDTFCIIIKQSLESGKSLQILEDMSNQITDVQKAIDLKEREGLERVIQLFQLLFFIGMIGICIYYLCLEIGNGLLTY